MTNDDWIQDIAVITGFLLFAALIVWGARSDRWRRAWLRLRADRIGLGSGSIIAIYLILGALEMIQAPTSKTTSASVLSILARSAPNEETYSAPFAHTTLSLQKPRPLHGTHLLGTDALGKDVFFQTLRACHTALVIGGLTSLIYIPLGTFLGILAGYFRRWVDDLIQYVYTVVNSIPDVLLLIAILLVLGSSDVKWFGFQVVAPGKTLGKIAFALSITYWINLCRLIRGETMRQNERSYITAARALGQSHLRIITDHILPNVMHLVLINLVLGFSNLVLVEATLSYLGVGAPIGTPSWGNMIDGARGELSRDPLVWWTLTSATGALFGLVLSLNLFGDALRRAFDPRKG